MNSTFRLIAGTAAFGAVVMNQPAPIVVPDLETTIYTRSVTGQILQSDRGHGSFFAVSSNTLVNPIAQHPTWIRISDLPIESISRRDNKPPVTAGSGGTRARQTVAPFHLAL